MVVNEQELVTELETPVATLTLHRPSRLNAVTRGMYERIVDAFDRIRQNSDIRAVILTGSGRAFCAGADLKAHGAHDMSERDREVYAGSGQAACRAMLECTRPVIAAVNGHAIGAGLEMALAADLIVVAEDSKLRFPELGLGTFVGGGATMTLVRRAGITRAKELVMLGRFFNGRDAVAMGLANESLPAPKVIARARALAEELATKAPVPMGWAKRLFQDWDLDRTMEKETEALLECMRTGDWTEGIHAFEEKREPRFRGR